MATSASDVYDNFMMITKDYRLAALYETSVTDFEAYLEGFLVSAIKDFSVCDQSLAYSSGTFSVTLTQKNISILAKIMKKYWLEKEIADITQMNLHVTDRDFRVYSEAQNMSAKRQMHIDLREEISQILFSYEMGTVDWATWFTGTYYVP